MGGESRNAKHQMTHDLGMTAYPLHSAIKLILQPRINPLNGAAVMIADGFGRLMPYQSAPFVFSGYLVLAPDDGTD